MDDESVNLQTKVDDQHDAQAGMPICTQNRHVSFEKEVCSIPESSRQRSDGRMWS